MAAPPLTASAVGTEWTAQHTTITQPPHTSGDTASRCLLSSYTLLAHPCKPLVCKRPGPPTRSAAQDCWWSTALGQQTQRAAQCRQQGLAWAGQLELTLHAGYSPMDAQATHRLAAHVRA